MILASRAASRIVLAGCAALLAALALALSACGGDTPAKAGGTPVSSAEPAGAGMKRAAAGTPSPAIDKRCAGQVGEFLDAMQALRERLVAGLSYEEYVGEIGLIRGSYDAVPVKQLSLPCLSKAATPGESAFGRYIEAANSWGECIDEEGCDAAAVEPVLQKQWRSAARFLDEARSAVA